MHKEQTNQITEHRHNCFSSSACTHTPSMCPHLRLARTEAGGPAGMRVLVATRPERYCRYAIYLPIVHHQARIVGSEFLGRLEILRGLLVQALGLEAKGSSEDCSRIGWLQLDDSRKVLEGIFVATNGLQGLGPFMQIMRTVRLQSNGLVVMRCRQVLLA